MSFLPDNYQLPHPLGAWLEALENPFFDFIMMDNRVLNSIPYNFREGFGPDADCTDILYAWLMKWDEKGMEKDVIATALRYVRFLLNGNISYLNSKN